jgi:hypothetical protein
VADSAARRWGAAVPTSTEGSPTGTVLTWENQGNSKKWEIPKIGICIGKVAKKIFLRNYFKNPTKLVF